MRGCAVLALGHQLSGAAAGLLVAPLVPHPAAPFAVPCFVVITTVSSLVPDLDQPGSKLSRSLGPITWGLAWVIAWLSRVSYHATKTTRDKPSPGNGHRTLTHTGTWCVLLGLVTFLAVLATPASAWALWAGSAVLVGNLAHIWGDALTLHGVPFWWPLSRGGKRWACVGLVPHSFRFRAGGHKVKNRIQERSRFAWINIGEGIVTLGLTVLVGLTAALTVWAGGGPWWDSIASLLS
jgi:membrane-bound metal-dependent hydrolase YbcI (DUF457 family)